MTKGPLPLAGRRPKSHFSFMLLFVFRTLTFLRGSGVLGNVGRVIAMWFFLQNVAPNNRGWQLEKSPVFQPGKLRPPWAIVRLVRYLACVSVLYIVKPLFDHKIMKWKTLCVVSARFSLRDLSSIHYFVTPAVRRETEFCETDRVNCRALQIAARMRLYASRD